MDADLILAFCGDEFRLPPLPWHRHHNDRVYATDARTAVSLPADAYDGPLVSRWDAPPKRQLPDVAAVIEPVFEIGNWHELPEIGYCRKCRNNGYREICCDSCGKETLIECGCDVLFSGRHMARWIVQKIRTLPGIRWGVLSGDPLSPIYFVGDEDLRGAAMPKSPPDGSDLIESNKVPSSARRMS